MQKEGASGVPRLPFISIVTPVLNQGGYLEQALVSVLTQEYSEREYFVVDGGSTDGSVQIIERYGSSVDYWDSRPDDGQSDAIAKGFERASGEILNWLNADDLLFPGALEAVARAFAETGADIVVGEDLQFVESPERPVGHFTPASYRYPDCVRFWQREFRYHQPCTFFRRSLYERVGGLNRNLHYAMDFDLYCRMLAEPGMRVHYLPRTLSAFRLHAEAKTSRAKPGFTDELRWVARQHWEKAGLDASDARDMNRYCAECSLHQGMESFRGGRLAAALRGVARAVAFAPFHAGRYAIQRILRKGFGNFGTAP